MGRGSLLKYRFALWAHGHPWALGLTESLKPGVALDGGGAGLNLRRR